MIEASQRKKTDQLIDLHDRSKPVREDRSKDCLIDGQEIDQVGIQAI
jgi:hypothetical protein